MSIQQLTRFFGDVKKEANRITWPSLKDTRQMTIMVFILASIVAVFLLLVDMAIGGLLSLLLGL